MPLYEYRCRSCQQTFSRLLRLADDVAVVRCPQCHGEVTRLWSTVALHRSEASRVADYDPAAARRPDFYRDPRNIRLAAKRRLRDSNLDLGPRVDEIVERGRTGQILGDVPD